MQEQLEEALEKIYTGYIEVNEFKENYFRIYFSQEKIKFEINVFVNRNFTIDFNLKDMQEKIDKEIIKFYKRK